VFHSRPLGCAPPDAVKDKFTLTIPPGTVLPEPIDRITCCASANPDAAANRLAPASRFISNLQEDLGLETVALSPPTMTSFGSIFSQAIG
jgi:hypothetical protein